MSKSGGREVGRAEEKDKDPLRCVTGEGGISETLRHGSLMGLVYSYIELSVGSRCFLSFFPTGVKDYLFHSLGKGRFCTGCTKRGKILVHQRKRRGDNLSTDSDSDPRGGRDSVFRWSRELRSENP